MRVKLSPSQQAARTAALKDYEHGMACIGPLARKVDCLPVYVDWTAFLGIRPDGECVWVDHDDVAGRIEAVADITALSTCVVQAAAVPGLDGLKPPRPSGRADCEHCGGQGSIRMSNVEVGCRCGGLGWLALSPDELGMED